MAKIAIQNFFMGEGEPLVLICGPCAIQSEDHALFAAESIKKIASQCSFPLIYKSSFDKANRLSLHSFRGVGLQEGLRILEKVKKEFDLPVLTDIHTPDQAKAVGEVCDVLQIPAFLCRQTDLLLAAGQTKAVVNIKKGQFLSPWDINPAIEKVLSTQNTRIFITERGTSFGYNNLVSDMRSIAIMKKFGYPICYDATHSIQLPGASGGSSGGNREFIPTLAKAAVAAGCHALFIEAHENPSSAPCDSASMLSFEELTPLLNDIKKISHALNG
jgi:2-dehydro-3-deoxyphosphooctonate aldolase (KDO 8-P synthase)